MKSFFKVLLLTGIAAIGTNGLLAAQTGNSWAEQIYRAKYGRPSPTEEARLKKATPVVNPERVDLSRLQRDARTAEQYSKLADHYADRQRTFKRKAAEMMHLWAERSAMITPLSEKWPRPVDSARNLYDYYSYKAAQSAALVAKYSRLADEVAAK